MSFEMPAGPDHSNFACKLTCQDGCIFQGVRDKVGLMQLDVADASEDSVELRARAAKIGTLYLALLASCLQMRLNEQDPDYAPETI